MAPRYCHHPWREISTLDTTLYRIRKLEAYKYERDDCDEHQVNFSLVMSGCQGIKFDVFKGGHPDRDRKLNNSGKGHRSSNEEKNKCFFSKKESYSSQDWASTLDLCTWHTAAALRRGADAVYLTCVCRKVYTQLWARIARYFFRNIWRPTCRQSC